MKTFFKIIFSLSGYSSGRRLILHSSVILLLFFLFCKLYTVGFWVCLLAFLVGQLFLSFSEILYCLILRILCLIWGVLPIHASRENP